MTSAKFMRKMMVNTQFKTLNITDDNSSKKGNLPYKRKRIITQPKKMGQQLTKKKLDEFNNANTRDYLSDEGEEAV